MFLEARIAVRVMRAGHDDGERGRNKCPETPKIPDSVVRIAKPRERELAGWAGDCREAATPQNLNYKCI